MAKNYNKFLVNPSFQTLKWKSETKQKIRDVLVNSSFPEEIRTKQKIRDVLVNPSFQTLKWKSELKGAYT